MSRLDKSQVRQAGPSGAVVVVCAAAFAINMARHVSQANFARLRFIRELLFWWNVGFFSLVALIVIFPAPAVRVLTAVGVL